MSRRPQKTPELLNQEQLEKLSQDPKNRVYTYVHDNPTATFSVAQQKQCVASIRQQYVALRASEPLLSDAEARKRIRETSLLDAFAENNTRIFELLTSRQSSPDQVNHIRYMLYLREQKEEGTLDDATAQAMIQDYLVTAFKTNMTPQEYEASLKKK